MSANGPATLAVRWLSRGDGSNATRCSVHGSYVDVIKGECKDVASGNSKDALQAGKRIAQGWRAAGRGSGGGT